MHKATLEALLRAQNYTVLQLLSERNNLLREQYFALIYFAFLAYVFSLHHRREMLGAPKIKYSDTNFITPRDPDALLPYCIAPSGAIVPFQSGQQ